MLARRRVLIRFALACSVLLLVPVLPMPGFVTETVAAAETEPLPSLQIADDSALEELNAATDEPLGGGQRVVGQSDDVDEFAMIGVSLDEPPSEPILVRVREQDDEWGSWRELQLELDEGPDLTSEEAKAQTVGTEPLWVDSADAYEVSLGAEDADGADVIVVREREQRVVAEFSTAGAAEPPLSGMHSRAEWGARAPKRTPSVASTVKLAVVHHSVSSNSYSPGEVPGVLRGIQAYHMDGRGWDDIGYNFVVDRYGGIWEARGGGPTLPVVGAHAAGFNTGAVGVMLLGDFTSTDPTGAAVDSAGQVIGWKLSLHDVEPSGRVDFTSGGSNTIPAGTTVNLPRVIGHRDVGSTACPGHGYNYLGTVRAKASAVFPLYLAARRPAGQVESVVGGNGTVRITGWAVDRAATGPAYVRASAGTAKGTFSTTLPRPDVSNVYGGNGYAGFSGTLSGVPPGMQAACATVWSARGHDNDQRLGCTWVLVGDPTGASPVGRFDGVTSTPGQIHVSGWALDPGTPASVATELVVDGTTRATMSASLRSSTVPSAYTSLGTAHRFVATASALVAGPHTVCVRARNQGAGVDTLVDCRIVTVAAHSPGGVLENVGSTRRGKIDITGWALDLESIEPINVLLVVGGQWHLVAADRRRDDIGAIYPDYGPAHGIAATVNAAGGPTDVCAYGINVAGGSNTLLGCRSVNVVK